MKMYFFCLQRLRPSVACFGHPWGVLRLPCALLLLFSYPIFFLFFCQWGKGAYLAGSPSIPFCHPGPKWNPHISFWWGGGDSGGSGGSWDKCSIDQQTRFPSHVKHAHVASQPGCFHWCNVDVHHVMCWGWAEMTSEYIITTQMKSLLSWDEKNLLISVILKCGIYPFILTEKKHTCQ